MELIGDYELIRDKEHFLGEGSFSQVYQGKYVGSCTYPLTKDTIIAIKIIDKKILTKTTKKVIQDEIEIMELIRHNPHINVVECYDIIQKDNNIYIIMEYCDSGCLKSIIKKPIKEKYIQYYFTQLAKGLKFLDDLNIIHRDIKPSNILLTNKRRLLKIADFGLAKIVKNHILHNTVCGSPLYMAPEIIGHDQYNKQTDLWSIGMILFEMLYGFHPYNYCRSKLELQHAIKNTDLDIPPPNNRNKDVSKECINLLKNLLQKNARNRITWNEFFNNDWIKNINADTKGDSVNIGSYESSEKDRENISVKIKKKIDIIENFYDSKIQTTDEEGIFELELEFEKDNYVPINNVVDISVP